MKLLICAIYDHATQAFMQPLFVPTKAAAIRSFADAVSDGKSVFCAHPEDYVMMELGSFDDSSGEIVTPTAPVKVITALECVKPRQE